MATKLKLELVGSSWSNISTLPSLPPQLCQKHTSSLKLKILVKPTCLEVPRIPKGLSVCAEMEKKEDASKIGKS